MLAMYASRELSIYNTLHGHQN